MNLLKELRRIFHRGHAAKVFQRRSRQALKPEKIKLDDLAIYYVVRQTEQKERTERGKSGIRVVTNYDGEQDVVITVNGKQKKPDLTFYKYERRWQLGKFVSTRKKIAIGEVETYREVSKQSKPQWEAYKAYASGKDLDYHLYVPNDMKKVVLSLKPQGIKPSEVHEFNQDDMARFFKDPLRAYPKINNST